jgi:hypothetical protein
MHQSIFPGFGNGILLRRVGLFLHLICRWRRFCTHHVAIGSNEVGVLVKGALEVPGCIVDLAALDRVPYETRAPFRCGRLFVGRRRAIGVRKSEVVEPPDESVPRVGDRSDFGGRFLC